MRKFITLAFILLSMSSCAVFYERGDFKTAEINQILDKDKHLKIFVRYQNPKKPKFNEIDGKMWLKEVEKSLSTYKNITYKIIDNFKEADLMIDIIDEVEANYTSAILSGLTFLIIPGLTDMDTEIRFITKDKGKVVKHESATFALGLLALPLAPFSPIRFHVKENMIKSGINELISKDML